jgi:hypothetical protein
MLYNAALIYYEVPRNIRKALSTLSVFDQCCFIGLRIFSQIGIFRRFFSFIINPAGRQVQYMYCTVYGE